MMRQNVRVPEFLQRVSLNQDFSESKIKGGALSAPVQSGHPPGSQRNRYSFLAIPNHYHPLARVHRNKLDILTVFHSVGFRKIAKRGNIHHIGSVTSNSIISITNIAGAVVSAIAMQFTCPEELATSMKSHTTRSLGFLLELNSILFMIFAEKK
jgi:hypothetical protein